MAVKSTRNDALTWTLGAGVADTFEFLDSPSVPFVRIYNTDPTNIVWVRDDGTTAVAAADGAIPVPPVGGTAVIIIRSIGGVRTPLSIVSAGASVITAIKWFRPASQ